MINNFCIGCGNECFMNNIIDNKGPYCTNCSDVVRDEKKIEKSQHSKLMPTYRSKNV